LRRKLTEISCRLLRSIVDYFEAGDILPIRPITVYDVSSIEEAFRQMQQGHHVGKLVISIREDNGSTKITTDPVKSIFQVELDSSASYLLIGGLGGLGRAVSRRMVNRGARRLVYLSRSAGQGQDDGDFVRELESMGCEVTLVKGSVSNVDDVARTIEQAPNLKGIMQCSMVLCDQAFPQMTLEEWNVPLDSKIKGTWHLHNVTQKSGINLDFFVLFSSMSGVTGQAGQANYAGANTFLDAFVQYRTSLGLAASAIDIGAVQDVGYVSQDEALLKRIKVAGAHGVTEPELLDAVTDAMRPSVTSSMNTDSIRETSYYADRNTIILGLGTSVPLSSPESRAFWRKDRRMAIYHNASDKTSAGDIGSDQGGLQAFLLKAKAEPSILTSSGTANHLAMEIGKKLFNFLLKSSDDLNIHVPLSQLGMDSLVGVEMRSWWRQEFGFDITVLEMMGMGNLDALGRHAAEGLLKLAGGSS
jgi:NAD(P)-dependent dehydrogenase (short-subunit alcohol dehydrogenase family)